MNILFRDSSIMKGSKWRGVLYCFLWYFSIFCGFLTLCCPMLTLMLFNNPAYRQAVDLIFASWELYPVALMEVLFGTEVVINGDSVLPWDKSILIMNHRTRLDWNFLWAGMHYGSVVPAHRMKFILKAPIRHVPGPGWVMQLAGFFFIRRKWEQDEHLLASMLEYLHSLNYTYQVLIFPEGTDLTKDSILRSNSYADKFQLEHYNQLLHPKTTGFVFLVNKMRSMGQLDAVYDLTIGYPHTLPETELDVLKGYFPEQVHFNIKRYSVNDLPTSNEGLKQWLCEKWKEKEETLTRFYENSSFPTERKINRWPRPLSNALHLAILYWTSLICFTFYLLLVSILFRYYALSVSCLFIVLSFMSDGMNHIEIAWYKLRFSKKPKSN